MTGELGTILMLHRVAPHQPSVLVHNENLKISPEELESVIKQFQKMKRVFISLDELQHILKSKQKPKHKFIVFTLDDGYRDNLEFALPIFRKYEVPFCVYVTNCFPNRTTNLWWYALESAIEQNKGFKLPDGNTLPNLSPKQKNTNFIFLRSQILQHHFIDPLAYLNTIGDLSFDLEKEISDKCMSWQEINELSREDLATIGCHTMNHYPLARLTEDQARFEIAESKKELESKLGRIMNHFAFPFGGRAEAATREYAVARESGFDTISTTWQNHIYGSSDLKQLDRIFMFPLQRNEYTLNRLLYRNPAIFISKARRFIQRTLGK